MWGDALVVLVVGIRLGIRLLIFRYPIPAIVTALALEAAGRTTRRDSTDLDTRGRVRLRAATDDAWRVCASGQPCVGCSPQLPWRVRTVGPHCFDVVAERSGELSVALRRREPFTLSPEAEQRRRDRSVLGAVEQDLPP